MKNIVEQVLPMLIEDNKRIKGTYEKNKQFMNITIYLKLMCTIKLCLARGSGHTTAIKNMANYKTDLVIDIFHEEYKGSMFKVITTKDIKSGILHGVDPDKYQRVFIDNASRLFEIIDEQLLYAELSRFHNLEIIIALG